MSLKSQSNWKRNLTKREIATCQKIKIQIIQKKKTKTGITTDEILQLMKRTRNFVGCYAENELSGIRISSFPSFFIVNIDSSDLPGSHWLAVLIDRKSVEIFDSSGFNIFHLPRIPCHLLSFIHRLTQTRELHVSRQLQPITSKLCGFYAMFFVLCRQHLTFDQIMHLFTHNLSKNDRRLINFF